MCRRALPQKSDYEPTYGANAISAPKIILTYCSGRGESNAIRGRVHAVVMPPLEIKVFFLR